jgi:hypothetical protein
MRIAGPAKTALEGPFNLGHAEIHREICMTAHCTGRHPMAGSAPSCVLRAQFAVIWGRIVGARVSRAARGVVGSVAMAESLAHGAVQPESLAMSSLVAVRTEATKGSDHCHALEVLSSLGGSVAPTVCADCGSEPCKGRDGDASRFVERSLAGAAELGRGRHARTQRNRNGSAQSGSCAAMKFTNRVSQDVSHEPID